MPPKLTLENEPDILKPAKRRAKTQEPRASGPTDNFGAMPTESKTNLQRKKRKVHGGAELCPPEHVENCARIQPEIDDNALIQSSAQLASREAKILFFPKVKLTENKSPLAPTQKKVSEGFVVDMGKSKGLKVKQALITSFRAEMINTQIEGNSASEGIQNMKD